LAPSAWARSSARFFASEKTSSDSPHHRHRDLLRNRTHRFYGVVLFWLSLLLLVGVGCGWMVLIAASNTALKLSPTMTCAAG
jgi:hypothetical protein